MAPIYPLYTDCILDFEALCRLTDFYVDFNLNINRIIQLDDKAPQNLKYNLYMCILNTLFYTVYAHVYMPKVFFKNISTEIKIFVRNLKTRRRSK
jgi:hypothetical protein